MESKTHILRKYSNAKPEMKVDIICKYYTQIDEIINARIAGMKYFIWEEKKKSKLADKGELGVKVQCRNRYSDPTGEEGSFRADLENAIRNCCFSEDILEGISDPEKIISESMILKQMREIKGLYDMQISCLVDEDRGLYMKYLNHEMNLTEIASSCGIEYHSAVKRISKLRRYIKQEVTDLISVTSRQIGTR